jgi:hypothetical protein
MTHPTPDQRADILSSLAIGVDLDAAARAMGTTGKACRALAEADPAWAAQVKAATAQGLAVGSEEQAGGVVQPLPGETMRQFAARQTEVKREAVAYVPLAKAETFIPAPKLAEGEDIPDWSKFAEEAAAEYGPGRMGLYLKQDERLVRGGQPAASPWWRWTISEFLASDLTWLIAMVGRGAGKSTNLERLLLLIVIWTRRFVPPGQPWSAPFMSVVEDDSARRIKELAVLIQTAYHD